MVLDKHSDSIRDTPGELIFHKPLRLVLRIFRTQVREFYVFKNTTVKIFPWTWMMLRILTLDS